MSNNITVSGNVCYSDITTPVAGAKVTIRDLDGSNRSDADLILQQTTGHTGRFSGSGAWKDREGTVLGVDVPDILRLEFTVTADGHTHRGPFLRLDAQRSAPIILPFPPPKPVSRAKRALVQVIFLSKDRTGPERALYEFIEVASEALTQATLGALYRTVTFVKGEAATLSAMVGALATNAARSEIEAVDLLFTTHGSNNAVSLADGQTPEADLRKALLRLPAAARAKLRICFSTACFGETHLDTWMAAGFTEASGAEGIYADSAVSYEPFLAAWAAERTFAEAVNAANLASATLAGDDTARAFYEARNMPANAADIDSHRVRAGAGRCRIYSNP